MLSHCWYNLYLIPLALHGAVHTHCTTLHIIATASTAAAVAGIDSLAQEAQNLPIHCARDLVHGTVPTVCSRTLPCLVISFVSSGALYMPGRGTNSSTHGYTANVRPSAIGSQGSFSPHSSRTGRPGGTRASSVSGNGPSLILKQGRNEFIKDRSSTPVGYEI